MTSPFRVEMLPEPSPIPESLGVVAFCRRNWRQEYSAVKPNAIIYLIKTVASLRRYVTRCRVLVGTDADLALVRALSLGVEVERIAVAPEPLGEVDVLPVARAGLASLDASGSRYVFFTEADQIVHIRDPGRLAGVVDDRRYAVPHRIERDYKGANRRGQPRVRFNSADFVVWNHPGEGEARPPIGDGFFRAATPRIAYGAGWLARADAVSRIDFLGPTDDPLAHPCHALFDAMEAVKTTDVFEFFVEHLSGFDNALAAFGLRIEDYPSFW
ncbi:hypothetical protein OJF2_15060 [Aquisphaera giovannonii]|uniref:Uncharacterized protein n=1 Tax=Aquisphaera giovannonii TaxID=406548 RepID=A0A5B9VYK0_9BACT|nr:hypothetical protein [Aquisphaera giovannonii]QEH33011.1 hypothetical protein OJF2_15060 [Aquisphaera giovannonii]